MKFKEISLTKGMEERIAAYLLDNGFAEEELPETVINFHKEGLCAIHPMGTEPYDDHVKKDIRLQDVGFSDTRTMDERVQEFSYNHETLWNVGIKMEITVAEDVAEALSDASVSSTCIPRPSAFRLMVMEIAGFCDWSFRNMIVEEDTVYYVFSRSGDVPTVKPVFVVDVPIEKAIRQDFRVKEYLMLYFKKALNRRRFTKNYEQSEVNVGSESTSVIEKIKNMMK